MHPLAHTSKVKSREHVRRGGAQEAEEGRQEEGGEGGGESGGGGGADLGDGRCRQRGLGRGNAQHPGEKSLPCRNSWSVKDLIFFQHVIIYNFLLVSMLWDWTGWRGEGFASAGQQPLPYA